MTVRKDVDVSAICVTHGRPYVLNEAVESFLRLKLPDGMTSEMIIVNDCEEQNLRCNADNVIVKNIKWIEVLAEKVNLAVGMSRGKWLLFFDDDDIHLPHIEIIPGYKQDYEALVLEAINKGIGVKK